MPVIAVLNQKGGVGKTTISVHLASQLAKTGRVLLIDADPQHSALDWSVQREENEHPSSFHVIGLPQPTLHKVMPSLSEPYDWVIIDGPPRVNDLAKSAVAASDLVIIPVQPAPYDVWAANDIVEIVRDCQLLFPNLVARFLINRLNSRTTLATQVKTALAEHNIPILEAALCDRTEYAKSARLGQTALETRPKSQASAEVAALAQEVTALMEMTAHA